MQSYNLNGQVKYIGVETTRAEKYHFIVRELLFSKQHHESYYRIFAYDAARNTEGIYYLYLIIFLMLIDRRIKIGP